MLISGGCVEQAAPKTQVDIAGLSHPGRVRPNNEDHFLIIRFGRFLETLQTNLPAEVKPPSLEESGCGMVVADGVGGGAAGKVASRTAICTLVELVLSTPDWIFRLEEDRFVQEALRRAKERYGKIERVLAEQAQADPSLRGLATTMTVAAGLGKDWFVAHIGDSRAYLYRQQRLHQLTRDHTLAQTLAEGGAIAQQDVGAHRLRHVLTQALGGQQEKTQPDVQKLTLKDGDGLLLCTDGLTEMVKDETIAGILGMGKTAGEACQLLVEQALQAGGKDNVTVIVAWYQSQSG